MPPFDAVRLAFVPPTDSGTVVYSPTTPALSYKTRPDVPPVMAVEPTSITIPSAAGLVHDATPSPFVVKMYPLVPPVVGSVKVHVPAAAAP